MVENYDWVYYFWDWVFPWDIMSQDCTKIIVLSIILFPILTGVDAGAGECRHRRIECFDCDSRSDPTCEHIDMNNPNSIKPNTRMCSGCCVKMVHRYYNGKGQNYVHRMCTEHIIINYFMVDHVCMSEGKQRGKMCFCEERLCNNSPPSKLINTNYSSILLLLLSTLATTITILD